MARRERTRIIKGKEQWKKLSFNFSESLKIRGIYMLAPWRVSALLSAKLPQKKLLISNQNCKSYS